MVIFIAFNRCGNIEGALTFAQTQMSEAGESNPEVLSELERTLALLAFEKPLESPFSDLLQQSHRQKVGFCLHISDVTDDDICLCLQVASELNAAILKMENAEDTSPRIINMLKLILWAQSELDKRNISYSKMNDLATATIEPK